IYLREWLINVNVSRTQPVPGTDVRIHSGFYFGYVSLQDFVRAHVEAALELVGLGDRMQHYPKQLSGGQEQRVAIARAVVTDPTIIVADEPTGDLDKISAEEILTLLERLNKESRKTIVMVTHDPRAAVKAHKVMHLDKGELTS
ncbi:MAG: ATP-binding cassette domain-containing protein, partial [Ignavibacteriae bacterium]|nr:ATP-binding cassette domain-containing protein [Ignavibacteriota bacterium]